MVFKFATFDPTQDPDAFNPAFPTTLSRSSSAATDQPCDCTRALISHVIGGASLVLSAPALEVCGDQRESQSSQPQFPDADEDLGPPSPPRQLKKYSITELKTATSNFASQNILEEDGFGLFYKGLLPDGSPVAIKRSRQDSQSRIRQFKREVAVGKLARHRNVVPLLGFCSLLKAKQLFLIYPFYTRGCVASLLWDRPTSQAPLDYASRKKIAIGVARGLSHLHELNVIHRGIGAANIMLDGDFEPHIGDFGLAIRIRQNYEDVDEAQSPHKARCVKTAVHGTLAHIAPEYLSTGKRSMKIDVFGFGIMLLELISGQRAYDATRSENTILLDWVRRHLVDDKLKRVVDPYIYRRTDWDSIEHLTQLALLCTQDHPESRPCMALVERILEGDHSLGNLWERYRIEISEELYCRDWFCRDSYVIPVPKTFQTQVTASVAKLEITGNR